MSDNREGIQMLNRLGDFSAKRSLLEALLFYIVYGAAGVFLCGVMTSIIVQSGIIEFSGDIKTFAMVIAPIVAGIYTLIIAIGVIISKQLGKDALAILCAIVGAFASASLGLIFGFMPIAALSAFNPNKKD